MEWVESEETRRTSQMNTPNDRSLTHTTTDWRPIIDAFEALAVLLLVALVPVGASAANHSLEDIRSAAERHVLNLARSAISGDVTVTAGRLDSRLVLSACDRPLETFDNLRTRLGSHVSVGVRCNSSSPWTLYVPVTVNARTRVITVASSQARGSILRTSDLIVTEQRALTQLSPFVTDITTAVGMELTRAVAAGTPLTLSMLAKPDIVKRGDQVTMVFEGELLRVTMSGQALQDGAYGDRIRLRNLRSKTTVEGEVQPDGTIRID